jgi:hypothetical protein
MVLFPLIADSPLQSVYESAQFVGFSLSLAQWSNLVPAAHAKHVFTLCRVVLRPFEVPPVNVVSGAHFLRRAKFSAQIAVVDRRVIHQHWPPSIPRLAAF